MRKPPAILEAAHLPSANASPGISNKPNLHSSRCKEEEVPFSLADEGNLTLVVLLGR